MGGNNSNCFNNNFLHRELQPTTQHELDYSSCFNKAEQIDSTLSCDFGLENDFDFDFYDDASLNRFMETLDVEIESNTQNQQENATKDVNAQENKD